MTERVPLPIAFRVLPAIEALALAREAHALGRQVRRGTAEAAALRHVWGSTVIALRQSALGLVD